MQASTLKGRAVVTLANATKVGSVDDILFDPGYQHVIGFVLKGVSVPGSSSNAAIPRGRVAAIGPDAITVASAEEMGSLDRFPELRDAQSLGQARGTKVVTEGGELLGTLDGFEIDDDAREVRTCTLAAPLLGKLLHHQNTFTPEHICQVGQGDLMVVDNTALQS